jgi:hypothetical protein
MRNGWQNRHNDIRLPPEKNGELDNEEKQSSSGYNVPLTSRTRDTHQVLYQLWSTARLSRGRRGRDRMGI